MKWIRWVVAPAAVAMILLVCSAYFLKRGSPSPPVARDTSMSAKSRAVGIASVSHEKNKNSVAVSPGVSWTVKFHASHDYLAFVSEALPLALKRDGRAAYYIGDALQSCALIIKNYKDSADPDAQLNAELAASPKAPQWTKDLHAQLVHRCLGLAQHDAFVDLPSGQSYNASYWYDSALSKGDALAEVRAASMALADVSVSASMPADVKAEKIQSAESNLQAAVASGDSVAMFYVGMAIANSRVSVDPTQGVALELAACELGYDCSADNPDNVFSNCKLSGACPADADFAYFVQESLGADKYAQAYARAQTVKQFIEAGDWAAVAANAKVGGNP
jgi:hypothetical protein